MRLRQWLAQLKAQSHDLNHGRDIITAWSRAFAQNNRAGPLRVLDIGCGRYATDLLNVQRAVGEPKVELYGVDQGEAAETARTLGVTMFSLDIEREPLPLGNQQVDIVIANQILEHTKEIFWILAEISRVLRPGGILIAGVPNLASLHNRVLLLAGEQPSAIELLGPHVRGFTIPSFRRLIESDGYYRLVRARGSNFYPFPPAIAVPLSRLFPALAVSSFFLVQRTPKPGTYIEVLRTRSFQTPYFDRTL